MKTFFGDVYGWTLHACLYNLIPNLDSKIERGNEEEMMEAYILVRRRDDDDGDKVI